MDIFSHGLWAAAAAKGVNQAQDKRRVNVWAAMLWGVFPDLFAFSIPFLWLLWSFAFGDLSLANFRPDQSPVGEPIGRDSVWVFQLSSALYNVSHSLVIFTVVFLGVWAYFKQARLELIGWLLHIITDVPTHTYAFFPTPVFWPLFDWKFNGFAWGQPWFMLLNYSLLLLALAFLWKGHIRIKNETNK